jgi:GFO/IDH/MocA oxidoreductase family protein
MLARNDIDGVMIATGDFQHAKLCTAVVRAGKDCYVEKPFANVLAEAKEARDTVKASKQIVQMGTQHRSQPYPLAVREITLSMTANGGIFVWNDGRENADTCVAAATYPSGFLYTYKTTFGNSYRSFSRICGRDGTIENYGGEGASLFVLTKGRRSQRI